MQQQAEHWSALHKNFLFLPDVSHLYNNEIYYQMLSKSPPYHYWFDPSLERNEKFSIARTGIPHVGCYCGFESLYALAWIGPVSGSCGQENQLLYSVF